MDQDNADRLTDLKKYLDDLEKKEEENAALRMMAKYNLEGERPTKFFFKLNKQFKSATQIDTLIVKEEESKREEKERTIRDQKTIEWEVRKFYWKLYKKQDVEISKDEIVRMTGNVKKITQHEKSP